MTDPHEWAREQGTIARRKMKRIIILICAIGISIAVVGVLIELYLRYN